MNSSRIVLFLWCCVIVLFVADVCLGSVYIPISDITNSLLPAGTGSNANSYIIANLRIPRAITAVLTGSGLSIAGLLMQTMFRNPLAGPFVLGISSGAGLGVALVIMGAGILGFGFLSSASLVIASFTGSFLVLLLTLFMSARIKDSMGLLIVGLMVGSLSSAVVGILSYFSTGEQLKRFVFWSLGSLGGTSWSDLFSLSIILLASILLLAFIIKSLNALLLGEDYAASLGVNLKSTRWVIIIVTSLLAGSITAFVGPIAFIGLAVPHLCRLLFPTVNHKILLPAVIAMGAALLLVCDIIARLPFSNYSLPINAVTSLIGAPVIIWLIIKKRSLQF
ncbi:MAG: iron ABC transporter permease [Nonlabens sp.]